MFSVGRVRGVTATGGESTPSATAKSAARNSTIIILGRTKGLLPPPPSNLLANFQRHEGKEKRMEEQEEMFIAKQNKLVDRAAVANRGHGAIDNIDGVVGVGSGFIGQVEGLASSAAPYFEPVV